MRCRVFLRRTQLCRSAILAVRDEHRVVAETRVAARPVGDGTRPLATDHNFAGTRDQRAGRDECRATTPSRARLASARAGARCCRHRRRGCPTTAPTAHRACRSARPPPARSRRRQSAIPSRRIRRAPWPERCLQTLHRFPAPRRMAARHSVTPGSAPISRRHPTPGATPSAFSRCGSRPEHGSLVNPKHQLAIVIEVVTRCRGARWVKCPMNSGCAQRTIL